MCNDRNAEGRMDFAKELMTRNTSISCKGPAQPALPRMRCGQTPNTGGNDERFQHDGAGIVPNSLIEQLQDRNQGGSVCYTFQVAQAEHHADAEKPSCHEADGNRAHYGNGYHFLWSWDFFGQMCCTVETSKGPITVDKTNNESDTILGPSGRVDKGSENEFGRFVGWRFGWNGDEDHGERDEGDV